MFAWVLTNSIITATEQLERALAAAVCNAPPPGLLRRLFGWMLPLWPLLSARHLFVNWYKVLLVNLPAVMKQGSTGEILFGGLAGSHDWMYLYFFAQLYTFPTH